MFVALKSFPRWTYQPIYITNPVHSLRYVGVLDLQFLYIVFKIIETQGGSKGESGYFQPISAESRKNQLGFSGIWHPYDHLIFEKFFYQNSIFIKFSYFLTLFLIIFSCKNSIFPLKIFFSYSLSLSPEPPLIKIKIIWFLAIYFANLFLKT